MSFLSHRLDLIKPSATLAVNQKARLLKQQGRSIIDLSVGEPDFDTPDFIKEAAIKAIEGGETKYTPVMGTENLRKAIQSHAKNQQNIAYKLSEIIVTSGAKQALFNAFLATLDDLDEVIIPAPYWVSYPEMVALFKAKPVIVECFEDQMFKITPEQLEKAITPQTKWFLLNTPSNPTGMCYSVEELKALAGALRKHPHVFILCDDIYENLVYEGFEIMSLGTLAPDLKERMLIVSGVSKSYAMTGWRLGYAMGPEFLINAMNTLQSQSTSNASSISQAAALAALTGENKFLKNWIVTYTERRDFVLEHLNSKYFQAFKPQGAFYIFLSCKPCIGLHTPSGNILKTDIDVANYLLEEAGVALVPGSAFGAPFFLRLSFALKDNHLKEAIMLMNTAASKLT
jgi:aspartate aminotransferase